MRDFRFTVKMALRKARNIYYILVPITCNLIFDLCDGSVMFLTVLVVIVT